MYRTNDPLADFQRWDSDRERALTKLPKCSECDEYIQDDKYYDINDEPVCIRCLEKNHRKWTDDFIE